MDVNNMTRLTHRFHVVILILSIFVSSCSGQLIQTEPTLQDSLDASAADLALSYLSMKHIVRFAAIGIRTPVTIGHVTINTNNVDEYKAQYEGRLHLYEQAIW